MSESVMTGAFSSPAELADAVIGSFVILGLHLLYKGRRVAIGPDIQGLHQLVAIAATLGVALLAIVHGPKALAEHWLLTAVLLSAIATSGFLGWSPPRSPFDLGRPLLIAWHVVLLIALIAIPWLKYGNLFLQFIATVWMGYAIVLLYMWDRGISLLQE